MSNFLPYLVKDYYDIYSCERDVEAFMERQNWLVKGVRFLWRKFG